ncbi:MAG TPA: hypothetical protein VMD30_09800 [Tepidisphaeraceae bacterium]|nr:hypothetical protein [Tepidisphaeraceae bacterium]
MVAIPRDSVLFITLDSCRYDTFAAANLPNMRRVGPLHKAMAPGSFTFASHAAMFVGFTPGVAEKNEPFVNPKFGKIFRMGGIGFEGKASDFFTLQGRNIIDGFRQKGYVTIGTGAVPWFNPNRPTSLQLTQDFEHYFWPGDKWSLRRQLKFVSDHLGADSRPAFVFINVGETHIPYFHEGAAWDRNLNPCVPFGKTNDAAECRRRQTACVEFVDAALGPLLDQFSQATTLLCADHGDCWGEDGLWDHGIFHPKVYEVPLLFRLAKS